MAYTDPNYAANFMRYFAPQAAQQIAPQAQAAPPAINYASMFGGAPAQGRNFIPALEFANLIGTQMAAQGGNQLGAAIGGYNAQTFQNYHDKQNSQQAYGQGQGQPQQPVYQMPQQPMAMPGAPGQTSPVDYRSYFPQSPGLAQTQIGGAPPMGFTTPPATAGNSGLLGGLQGLANARGFDPRVWGGGIELGQRQAQQSMDQAREARTAATFNPELINQMQQLEAAKAQFDYQKAFLPDMSLDQVGHSILKTQTPGLAWGPDGQLQYQGDPTATPIYTAPAEPEIRTAGGSIVQIGPDGTPKVLYTAPQEPKPEPARNIQYIGTDAQGHKQFMDLRTNEIITGGLESDPTAPKVGVGVNPTVARVRVAQLRFQKLNEEFTSLSQKVSSGTITEENAKSAIARMKEIKPKIEQLQLQLSSLTPEGDIVGEIPAETAASSGASDYSRIPPEQWDQFEAHLKTSGHEDEIPAFQAFRKEQAAGK